MGSDWEELRLGDYVDSCLGKMLDKKKNKGTALPYLGNKNVRWGSFDTENLAEMRFEEHEHERYGLRYGDLVVCEGGEPGRCAIWKDQISGMKIQKALHRIRPHERFNNAYLHYWFLWTGKTGALEPFFTGTTIKHLTGRAIAELQVPAPPLPEQKAIAHVLGALDDRIELNRQMNETLESMAQALFKSWFVDFEPVLDNGLASGKEIPEELQDRAKARQALGESKKSLPPEIRTLFPDQFTYSEELGWIPEGWEVEPLSEITVELRRGISPKYTEEGGVRVVNQRCIRNHEIDYSLTRRNDETKRKVEGRFLEEGDLLVNSTGVGTLGRMAQVHHLSEPTVVDSHVTIARADKDKYLPYTFACMMLSLEPYVEAMGEGSTGQTELSRKNLAQVQTIVPPLETQKIAEQYFYDFYHKASFNNEKSDTLSLTRDTLLPKLLSGELRIPDAEKMVEELA